MNVLWWISVAVLVAIVALIAYALVKTREPPPRYGLPRDRGHHPPAGPTP